MMLYSPTLPLKKRETQHNAQHTSCAHGDTHENNGCAKRYPIRRFLNRLALSYAHSLDEETAHAMSLVALRMGLGRVLALPRPSLHPSLARTLCGKTLAHPIMLAAGFDKNASAVAPLLASPLSGLEVGTVTRQRQKGNSRPRLFRAPPHTIHNRYGLNNDGIDAIIPRLQTRRRAQDKLVGLSLGYGHTKTTEQDIIGDITDSLTRLSREKPVIDYVALNLSCPNISHTPDMFFQNALAPLARLLKASMPLCPYPLFIKIPLTLDKETYDAITHHALKHRLHGLIIGNSIPRPYTPPRTTSPITCGVSGKPLTSHALTALRHVHKARQTYKGQLTLISSGGLMDGDDAYERLNAGADMLQIYTALIYDGVPCVYDMLSTITSRMATPSSS